MQGLGQLAARLGQGAQGGQSHALQPRSLEHAVSVGHAGQRGNLLPLHQLPEGPLQHAAAGKNNGCPCQQMGIEDGHAVGVAHGQIGDGTLRLGQPQVLHNGFGVGLQIAGADAHQLGAAGTAGGGEQQGQLGVEFRALRPPAEQLGILQGQVGLVLSQHLSGFLGQILRDADEGGLVGGQQAFQQLRRDVGVQQQGDCPGIQAGEIAHQQAGGVLAQQKDQLMASHGPAQPLGGGVQIP